MFSPYCIYTYIRAGEAREWHESSIPNESIFFGKNWEIEKLYFKY